MSLHNHFFERSSPPHHALRVASKWLRSSTCDYCFAYRDQGEFLELDNSFKLSGIFTGVLDRPVAFYSRPNIDSEGELAQVTICQDRLIAINELAEEDWMKVTAAEVTRQWARAESRLRAPARVHYTAQGF